jgi:hypothetical protein
MQIAKPCATADHLASIVDGLLDNSQIETGDPSLLNAADLTS